MRAVRYHRSGGPEVLQLDEVDRPSPRADEVVVEVQAASINPTDAKRRDRGTGPLPKTTGSDFAGVVATVGDAVDAFSVGDRVCGTGLHTTRFQQGSFADYVAVPTDIVTHLPEGVSFERGAAVALVGVTAWWGLVDVARLAPTESCLIHGGTGGVGHVAVQLASILDADTIATAAPGRLADAADFGANTAVSYSHGQLLDAVRHHSPEGVDVIFDHRANEYFSFDLEAAGFAGRIILYGDVDGPVELRRTALQNNLTISVMTMSNLATKPDLPTIASKLDPVLALVAEGKLDPTIADRYSLEEAAAAHRAILDDSFIGKLVVVP